MFYNNLIAYQNSASIREKLIEGNFGNIQSRGMRRQDKVLKPFKIISHYGLVKKNLRINKNFRNFVQANRSNIRFLAFPNYHKKQNCFSPYKVNNATLTSNEKLCFQLRNKKNILYDDHDIFDQKFDHDIMENNGIFPHHNMSYHSPQLNKKFVRKFFEYKANKYNHDRESIENYFFRKARLPPSGTTDFDPQITPVWAGIKLPG